MPTDGQRFQKRTPATVSLQVSSATAPYNPAQEWFTVFDSRRHDTPLGWSYIQRLGRGWTLRNPQEWKCSSGMGTGRQGA